MRRRTALLGIAVLVALPFAGCGDDAPDAAGGTRPADPASGAMLPSAAPLTVADALASTLAGPLLVRATLLVGADGAARLCDTVRESYPPQCGDPSMPITGLPPELVASLAHAGGVRWSDEPVTFMGRVRDGVFVNDPELLAAS